MNIIKYAVHGLHSKVISLVNDLGDLMGLQPVKDNAERLVAHVTLLYQKLLNLICFIR